MNDKELIGLESFGLDLNDESSLKMIQDSLAELRKKGYSKVNIEIKTSPEQELQKLNIDEKLFNKIKETQELPDWVVIKLIQASGKLKNTNFNERF
jgi:DNA-binding protein YbaB